MSEMVVVGVGDGVGEGVGDAVGEGDGCGSCGVAPGIGLLFAAVVPAHPWTNVKVIKAMLKAKSLFSSLILGGTPF
jgi:hypothetical protein